MKKKYLDCVVSVILILFGLWGWYETSKWKAAASHAGISPRVYPRAVFTVIMICGLIILVRALVKMSPGKADGDSEQTVEFRLVKVAVTVALMLLYIVALGVVGFLAATPVFLFLTMLFFGERGWLKMILISAAGSGILYLFFVQVLKVRF